jgi:hypothetical protein
MNMVDMSIEYEHGDKYDATKVVQSKKRKHFETAGLDKVDKLKCVPGIGKAILKKLKAKTITTKVDDLMNLMGSTSGLMLIFLQLQDPDESFEFVQDEFYRFLTWKLDISERQQIHQIVSAISNKVKQLHLWKSLSLK